ncbi:MULTISPECIES: hypothetical protein [Moorena]|nr:MULTISPECIES: hypothetical protein [Moorena]
MGITSIILVYASDTHAKAYLIVHFSETNHNKAIAFILSDRFST